MQLDPTNCSRISISVLDLAPAQGSWGIPVIRFEFKGIVWCNLEEDEVRQYCPFLFNLAIDAMNNRYMV